MESPGVTTLEPVPPIFWDRASGAHVTDVDGNEFIDLTAAFGVASVGHANERVAEAISEQATTLLHGMGDVYPSAVKVDLLRALADICPSDLNQSVLTLNGADAVETALKCAELVTKRSGVIAFQGAYHGLSYGALSVTAREDFRAPFSGRTSGQTTFFEYPRTPDQLERVVTQMDEMLGDPLHGASETGAIIVEPIQGRGGVVVPSPGFLRALRAICDRHDLLFIVDEIFTGLGRTGHWFAVEVDDVVPDLLCIGKALGGGMPLSACVGGPTSIGRWPRVLGEALHTHTFLGHPGSCRAGLASLSEIRERRLPERAQVLGALARDVLSDADAVEVRGRGLMIGIELESPQRVQAVVQQALQQGVLLLPCGDEGTVLSVTPPLVIEESDLLKALHVVKRCLTTRIR